MHCLFQQIEYVVHCGLLNLGLIAIVSPEISEKKVPALVSKLGAAQ